MEITESSSIPLETQNSQTSSQDIKNLSKSVHDVEASVADKGQITPVNESQSQDTLENSKVHKRVKKSNSAAESNKQLKKIFKSQKCEKVKTPKHSKTQSKEKDKSPKTVNSDKKHKRIKTSKVVNSPGAAQNVSEKPIIPKEQKSSKLSTTKKSSSEGNKQKLISKHNKDLLLSDYVTLSRDWSANRKTYTRNAIPVCVRAADSYDCLTQKSEEINSECTADSTDVSIETDSTIKGDSNGLPDNQLLDNVSANDRTDSAEIDSPTKVNFHDEKNNSALNDANAVLSENKTNSSHELLDLQGRTKSTILKQKNTKSKRKSVHFSDKIDLPIDSLNRNDIILEIANDLTAKNEEESMDHLSDVSANDAVNASIEIDKIQCPIKEQTKQKAYTKIVQKKINVNTSAIAFDDKAKQDNVKVNIVKKKRGRPRKVDVINEHKNENVLKAKALSKHTIAKLQDRKLKSSIFPTVANLQSEGGKRLLLPGPSRKRRPGKIIGSKLSITGKPHQRNGNTKANLHTKNDLRVKRGRKQNSIATAIAETVSSQQFIKRKRGRPRKYPLVNNNDYDLNSPTAKRMKLDSLNTKPNVEKSLVIDKSTISLKAPGEGGGDLSETTTESTLDKENKQVVTTDVLGSSDKASEQQEILDAQLEDGASKPLTSDSGTDIGNSEVSEELPSLNVNSGENETEVQYHSQKVNSSEICSENVSDTQTNKNKEQNVQNVKESFPNEQRVASESNGKKKQEIQQTQEMYNLEAPEVLVCTETSIENEANKEKAYRILKSNLESPEKIPCSDLNLVKSQSKEYEIPNTKMQNLEISETPTGSDPGAVENEANLHKVYKRQRLKQPVIKASEVSSNVNTSENKHSEQKTHTKQNLKKTALEALSELNNCDTNTFGNKRKVQKRGRKTRKTTHFKVSEIIYDNSRVNNKTEPQKRHRRKSKRTANVKMLLKKIHPISRKTKRKKKINTSKSRASKNSSANNGEKSFVCGVCRQLYNKLHDINYHIMLRHNGLARINDDTPFSSEEEISAFNLTLKRLKKLQCLQPDCGKTFISVLGYKYHRSHCGVKVPKVNCEVCGKVIKAVNLANHMRLSHTVRQDVVEEPTPEELPRRGAAVKALKKMENFIKTQNFGFEDNELNNDCEVFDRKKSDDSDYQESEDSDYQESDLSEEDYDEYCGKPQFFFMEMLNPWKENIKTPADIIEEINQKMTESWEQTLAETGKLKCGEKNCDKEFTSTSEMKSHLEHCNAKKWICKLCNRTYSQAFSLYNHVKRYHCLQETVNDSGEVSRKSSYSHINNLLNTSFDHTGSSRLLKPYLPALEWNMKFRKKHYKNELYSQWKPHSVNWIEMKKRNSSDYLPPLKESAFVKSLEENSPVWKRLGLFECPEWADKERQKTFFVGGSVWASSWCPTGMKSKTIQFLALAANSPEPHLLTDCSNRKGLIQLWDMGILETNRSLSTPNLTLAIAHENGFIWDMEWCPSGCWEEASDLQTEKKPDRVLPRLGLLAVACSNSSVRIYSIPHPHSIIKTKDSLPIFRCRPAVVLVGPESAPNISCHRTLCTKVSWQKTNGHSCLAAGFGNGTVCLWNLMSSSPLLIVSQFSGQLTLRPYLSFPAHGACIMGLLWVPVSGGQYLSTASYDRSVKVWNLEDHNWPLVVTRRGLITDIAWLPYWCGVFASLDDCYNLHHTSTFYKECGYYSFAPKALSAHFGCTWSLSVSDWLNAEASADASGEMVVTVLCQLMKLVDGIKLMSHRRVPLFRINVEPLDSSNEDEKRTESVLQNRDQNNEAPVHSSESKEREEKQIPPTNQKDFSGTNVDIKSYPTYEEAVEKVGLVLQDNDMENFSAISEKEFKRVRQPETMSSYAPDQYPLNSINKVSWNPNLGSHLWLFSAGQAGIARICCVFGLQSDKLRNTVNKCKENFKMAEDGL